MTAQPLIPAPVSLEALPGEPFTAAAVLVRSPEAAGVAELLGRALALPLADRPGEDGIVLDVAGPGGPESYRLDAGADGVRLTAPAAAGLFRGAQTLLQLLPAAPPWTVPAVRVADEPRFGWRGAMLDVSRHFFGVEDVQRFVDLAALYKLNVLHLHLTDDQGWRIAIDAWPRLAEHGGTAQVGGGAGGWYTRDDYARIVAYAAERHVTVVPEIDVPGHAHAALSAYPELGDGAERELHTGPHSTDVSLGVGKEPTLRFLDDVLAEVAALTPGDFIHLGGDEDRQTSHHDYAEFMEHAQRVVRRHGKRTIGWEEIANGPLASGTVVQHWSDAGLAREAAAQGAPLIMSPAPHAYLDMKYDADTPLGLSWAGHVEVRDAYDWDPAEVVPGAEVLGVEAPLWTETVEDADAIDYMTFPRLPAIAEVGWSPARDWEGFRARLAAHGPRWQAMGVNFYRSPQIDWRA